MARIKTDPRLPELVEAAIVEEAKQAVTSSRVEQVKVQISPEHRIEKSYPWLLDSWIHSAVQDPTRVDNLFYDLGVHNKGITEDLSQSIHSIAHRHPESFAPYEGHGPRDPKALWHIGEVIKDWFSGIRVVEEDFTLIRQQVPLFLFNSPSLPGAKVTYAESKKQAKNISWKIEVLGTGFGSDLAISVTHASEFISSAGDRKLVFAPLQVRVVRAALYKRDNFQAHFLKAELAETEFREANGVRSVNGAEWQELTSSGRAIDRFDLAGDTSGSIASYKRSYTLSDSFEWKLGLKAFDLETNLAAKCTAEHAAEMKLELPAGRVYDLLVPPSLSGLFFRT